MPCFSPFWCTLWFLGVWIGAFIHWILDGIICVLHSCLCWLRWHCFFDFLSYLSAGGTRLWRTLQFWMQDNWESLSGGMTMTLFSAFQSMLLFITSELYLLFWFWSGKTMGQRGEKKGLVLQYSILNQLRALCWYFAFLMNTLCHLCWLCICIIQISSTWF